MALFTKGTQEMLSTEEIASKLTYFKEQTQLIHWQTGSYAEHKATGELYEYIEDFKDAVVEKCMGYCGVIKVPKMLPINANANSTEMCNQIMLFAKSLKGWAAGSGYEDIENMAQELSGMAAKTKYLLTLS